MNASDVSDQVPPIRPIAELFRNNCVALWATTYNVDLDLFNEYLLGRLGDPPLNAVVIADRNRLDHALDAVPPERTAKLIPVNTRWLLRGAQLGMGRFHPKSYLAVTARTITLLVGSGNLSTGGLDNGREVFTAFRSGTPHGDSAITTWRIWMRRLVEAINDSQLAGRFADLEQRLPTPDGPTAVGASPLWHNLDEPIGPRFVGHVQEQTTHVDAIYATAPFYDEQAEALASIARALRPKELILYVASSTNVNGEALRGQLDRLDVSVSTFRYVPDRFTHAKLIAAIRDDRGWLLSGSANLSRAAMFHTAGVGNVELGVVTDLTAEAIRTAFVPPGVDVEPVSLEQIGELTYDDSDDLLQPRPFRIHRASWDEQGRVLIEASPEPFSSILLTDLRTTAGMVRDGERWRSDSRLDGPLVQLVDAEAAVMSNRVAIDDAVALGHALQVSEHSSRQQPPELTAADLETPLGKALEWLHQNLMMDVSERTSTTSAPETETPGSDEAGGDDDLWSRLEREALGHDPRVGNYDRLLGRRSSPGIVEPLLELLDAMRDRVPAEAKRSSGVSLLRQLVDEHEHSVSERQGSSWSVAARVRVRARNVLRRWAAAQTDPRLVWVNPVAPLANLKAIAAVFVQLWIGHAGGAPGGLEADDLDELWARWFRPIVGHEGQEGWIKRSGLSKEELDELLSDDFVENVSALCMLTIRRGSERRERVVEWQGALRAAFGYGLLDINDAVADFVNIVLDRTATVDDITEELLAALEYIDDDLWCRRTADLLSLGGLELDTVDEGQNIGVRLNVWGVADPLNDPRIPRLAVAAREYRLADSVAIYSLDQGWRIGMTPGDLMWFFDAAGEVHDSGTWDTNMVDELAANFGVLADFFRTSDVA